MRVDSPATIISFDYSLLQSAFNKAEFDKAFKMPFRFFLISNQFDFSLKFNMFQCMGSFLVSFCGIGLQTEPSLFLAHFQA